MRQQISFAGTKSSAKRPKTILTNMFCNLHKYNLYKHDFAIYTIQFCNFPIYLSIYTICNSGNFLPLAAIPAPNRKIFNVVFFASLYRYLSQNYLCLSMMNRQQMSQNLFSHLLNIFCEIKLIFPNAIGQLV